jgi:hypothetical protein
MVSDETPFIKYLEDGKIPTISFQVSSLMQTSPVSYAFVNAGGSVIQGLFGLVKRLDCKKVTLLRADPEPAAGVKLYQDEFLSAAKVVGVKAAAVQATPGTLDMSPYVARALSGGTDCLMVEGFGADEVNLMTAAKQAISGTKVQLMTGPSFLPPATVKSLGSILNGVVGVNYVWPSNEAAGHPGVQQFISQNEKYAPKPNDLTNNSELAWAMARLALTGISKVKGPVIAASITSALNSLGEYNPGISPPVNFSVRPSPPLPSRMFGPYAIEEKWVNGVGVTVGGFFNEYTGAEVK